MRGREAGSADLFSYLRLEERVPADPGAGGRDAGRAERTFRDAVFGDGPALDPAGDAAICATLLQAFFLVRSERMLMEHIDDNLLFRWFVGLEMDAAVWHPTVFTHNRDRLLEADVARAFLSGLLELRQVKRLLSNDHLSVDGTLIEAGTVRNCLREAWVVIG